MLYTDLTEKIIGCVYRVHRVLGPGLLEMPYHNALYYELASQGLSVGYHVPFSVVYEGHVVGEYFADLLVDNKVIVEIKAVSVFSREDYAQILNYLCISGCQLGLLVNFRGVSAVVKRVIRSG